MSHVTFRLSHVTCYMWNAYVDPLDMLNNFCFHVEFLTGQNDFTVLWLDGTWFPSHWLDSLLVELTNHILSQSQQSNDSLLYLFVEFIIFIQLYNYEWNCKILSNIYVNYTIYVSFEAQYLLLISWVIPQFFP